MFPTQDGTFLYSQCSLVNINLIIMESREPVNILQQRIQDVCLQIFIGHSQIEKTTCYREMST